MQKLTRFSATRSECAFFRSAQFASSSHFDCSSNIESLISQDFEALTPNILARTIETVEGGGIVVLLLRTVNSLKQLHTIAMDVHARYRTEAHQDVVARFNERFLTITIQIKITLLKFASVLEGSSCRCLQTHAASSLTTSSTSSHCPLTHSTSKLPKWSLWMKISKS